MDGAAFLKHTARRVAGGLRFATPGQSSRLAGPRMQPVPVALVRMGGIAVESPGADGGENPFGQAEKTGPNARERAGLSAVLK